ncbi:MAG: lamin tail domain-containing protein [Kiritimatiellae bacterium]|nr:lamin tail domain-containing protein [Kiritimatiellia bacterium]
MTKFDRFPHKSAVFGLFAASLLAWPACTSRADVLVPRGADWRYRKGTAEAALPAEAWRAVDFDDAGWASGAAPFGYGDPPFGTTLSDMAGSYATVYLRRMFTVADAGAVALLKADVDYDDGFILWINGEQVAAVNGPEGVPSHDALASAGHESGVYESITLPDPNDYLTSGENVIAVQVFNAGLASSDLKLDLELASFLQVADTTFSADRGFYSAPFQVTISTKTPGATIRYTTTGTAPTATTGTAGGTNAVVQINTTTCLRAAAFKAGFEPSDVDTQSYFFLDAVIRQANTPAGYPSRWQSVNIDPQNDWDGTDISADYAMDQRVVDDPRYSGTIKDDLMAIPTLSLACDPADLFDRYQGIYVNAVGADWSWDKEVGISAEYIRHDGVAGFQVNCGLKISGSGFRQFKTTRKKSFSLVFKDEWGPGKLRYDLFPDSPVDEYDNIALRMCGNDSFAMVPERGQFVRDQWGRDTQRAMGRVAAHGSFVHLYLNGLYWGLYNIHERIKQNLLAVNYGGEKEEYDILAGQFGTAPYYSVKAGTTDAFARTLTVRDKDLSNAANYAEMQQYLDLPPFIDYLIVCLYQPHLDWDYYYSPHWTFNNIRFACRRSPTGGAPLVPFQFFVWDIEHSMEIDSKASPDKTATPGPWALHQNLTVNKDYKLLFADRIQEHFYDGGALSLDACRARWTAIANQIDRAIVGETARWGGSPACPGVANNALWTAYYSKTGGGTGDNYHPRTRDDEWLAEQNRILNEFLPNRGATVLSQFRTRGLFPTVAAPSFHQHGGAIAAGFQLTVSAPAYTVYYTTDGSDPRLQGGVRASSALRYSGGIPLAKTTHVKARVWKTNNTWSPVNAATFNYTGHHSKIRITEILYNPIEGRHEFVEVKNTGTSTRGLSEMCFKGIRYTFPAGTELAAGQFVVLARDKLAFEARYGFAPFGQYGGALDNGGERLALLDSDGTTVVSVKYNDADPWPAAADGDGHSLVPAAPDGDYGDGAADDPANWRASNLIGGSPGYDDGAPYRVHINEALSHTDPPQVDAIELYNAGAAPADLGGWYLSDSTAEFKKFKIPAGTTLPAGGYLVFDESDFNTDTNNPACFALSSHGDEVYLTKWDANTNLQYLAEARFGGAENGVAFGRYVKTDGEADFVAQMVPHTLGGANAYPRVGPVIINECMYHPAQPACEFIELLNITDSPVALYDAAAPANTWKLDGAVEYAFPSGTSLAAREVVLLIATNEAAFRAAYPGVPTGVRIFGPYAGRLDDAGESIKLWRPDTPDPEGVPWLLVDRVKYNDNSPWPESADGDGPSLERQDAAAYGNDAVNWAASLAAGGTPGAANSGVLIPITAGWRYHDRGLDLGTAWRLPAHDDSRWADGNAPLGYGHAEIDTEVSFGDILANKHITTYFRKAFTLGVTPAAVAQLTLRAKYDDGFVAYLNGQEAARRAMPGGTIVYGTLATSHDAVAYETVDLTPQAGLLVQGVNVLAVELHQSGPASSDLFMDLDLTCQVSAGEPPAAPSSLTAAAASASRIDLSWADNSDNEAGFHVDRRLSGESQWVRIAALPADATACGDTNLEPDTTYYYKVKAHNAGGSSAYSAVASATTPPGPPAAPDNLVALPVDSHRIDLAWRDNSGNESGFRLERRVSGAADWVPLAATGADVTACSDAGLPPNTTYRYRVKACNAIGASAWSAVASATTPAPARAAGWTAYHDLGWLSGQPAQHITTAAGGTVQLVRFDTGQGTGVMLASSYGGGVSHWAESNPAPGTDAHGVFNGVVDCNGFISTASDPITFTFTGLDPAATYEVVVFGNRAGGYLDRLARMALSDADAFENASTAGATFSGATDDSVTICHGENTANGYVARFRSVQPGLDGAFTLSAALAGGSTAYFNALALRREGDRAVPNDEDRDGMSDVWETQYFGATNAAASGAAEDFDGDGLNNWEEYVAGSDPTGSGSYFAVDIAIAGGELEVRVPTVAAGGTGYEGLTRYYDLQSCVGPDGAWAPVPGYTNITGANQTIAYEVAENTNAPSCYRARVWLE